MLQTLGGFLSHLKISRKWNLLFNLFLIMAASGSPYLFAIYSEEIKKNLLFSQKELTELSTSKALGSSAGLLSIAISIILPPWASLVLASCTNFMGHHIIWLAVKKKIQRPSLWTIRILLFLSAYAQQLAKKATFDVCLKFFPQSQHGMIREVARLYVGISSALLTQVYVAIYGNSNIDCCLLLFLSFFPSVVFLYVAFNVLENQQDEKEITDTDTDVKGVYDFQTLGFVLGISISSLNIAQSLVIFSTRGQILTTILVLGSMLLPAMLAWSKKTGLANRRNEDDPKKPVLNTINNPKKGMLRISLLIPNLLGILVIGFGCTKAFIDNIYQIAEALLYNPRQLKLIVALFGMGNFGGKMLSGGLSERLLLKYRVTRPVMLSALFLILFWGLMAVAFPFRNSLYIAAVLIGFVLGAQFPMINGILNDMFGQTQTTLSENWMKLAAPIGSFLFNTKLTATQYIIETSVLSDTLPLDRLDKETCVGKQCFGNSFQVMAIATVFAEGLAVMLVLATSRKYMQYVEETEEKNTSSARGAGR